MTRTRLSSARLLTLLASGALTLLVTHSARPDDPKPHRGVLTGREAFGDWTTDAPGVRRKITVEDLTKPYDTPSAKNHPKRVDAARRGLAEGARGLRGDRVRHRPEGAPRHRPGPERRPVRRREPGRPHPRPPRRRRRRQAGGERGLRRRASTAPSASPSIPSGPEPRFVYVGNTDSVVRFPYRDGDLKATRQARGARRRHPQRRRGGRRRRALDPRPGVLARRQDPVTSRSGSRLERRRRRDARSGGPASWRSTPTGRTSGSTPRASATPSGWRSTRRRASSGPRSTSATSSATTSCPTTSPASAEGGFYGWPWYYLGPNQDPRHEGKHPELKDKVIVPDVLIQSHSASLDMTFYDGEQFPEEYRLDAFAAEHGSWNRAAAHRLQGDPHPDEGRPGDRRVRGLPRRLRHRGRRRLGPPGRRGRRPRTGR